MRNLIALLMTALMISLASASMVIPASDTAKDRSKAPDHSPFIGDNWELERVDFIHYAKPQNPGKLPKEETCFKLLGVKWKDTVTYTINPSNTQSIDFVTTAIQTSAEIWDVETSMELFNDEYIIDYEATYGVYDQKNSIDFGTYPDNDVIAVTSVWYIRRGKEIVESDIRFNTHFTWGNGESDPLVMDLQNIATHELGHTSGLADVYSNSCIDVTMYGYSGYGETKKRTLEQPDITGLQLIYGP